MAITIDPASKRLILDSASVSAQAIYAAWADWAATSDNLKYLPAFSGVGGDDLGGGLFIPPYYFLLNGWRVRPMESNHNLVITGNLFVSGGGVPVVSTLGVYQVNVNYTVPVQAQAMATAGGSGGLTSEQAAMLGEIWQRLGLDPINPLTQSSSSIQAGGFSLGVSEAGGIVTVARI